MAKRNVSTTERFLRTANSDPEGRLSDHALPYDGETSEFDDARPDAEQIIGNVVIMVTIFVVFLIIDLAAVKVIL